MYAMDIKEIRQRNLRILIETKLANGEFERQQDIAKTVSIEPSYLSQMLMERGTKGARSVSEDKARQIETKLGLPVGALDIPMGEDIFKENHYENGIMRPSAKEVGLYGQQGDLVLTDPSLYVVVPQFDVRGACGLGYTNEDELIKRGIVFREDWLRRKGISPKFGCSAVLYGDGESMRPTIEHNSILLANTAITTFDQVVSGKVYAFVANKELRIKRLFKEIKGGIRVVCDNPNKAIFPDEYISQEDLDSISLKGQIPWRGGDI